MFGKLFGKKSSTSRSWEIVGSVPKWIVKENEKSIAESEKLKNDPRAAELQERFERVVTPEFELALADIFKSIIERSGIRLEHSNLAALQEEPLFTEKLDGPAAYRAKSNRIVYNIGDSASVERSIVERARALLFTKLGLDVDQEKLSQMHLIQTLALDIHEKIHQMGRNFVKYRGNFVEEMGIRRYERDRITRKGRLQNWAGLEGLTDVLTFVILDELNARLGLNLDLDSFLNKFYPASEMSALTYSSYAFIMLKTIQKVASHENLPLKFVMEAFIRTYFAGGYYEQECRQLVDASMGNGYYDALAHITIPVDEDGDRILDGSTLPYQHRKRTDKKQFSKEFINNWDLGYAETDFGPAIQTLCSEKMFALHGQRQVFVSEKGAEE